MPPCNEIIKGACLYRKSNTNSIPPSRAFGIELEEGWLPRYWDKA